jgi:solute carrier family 25 (mitochondrial carnitine/acylcarnitine transporter), member 20/29
MFSSYFAAYEVTKKALTPAGSSPADLNLGAIMVAGGTAGVAMWSLVIPPDVRNSSMRLLLAILTFESFLQVIKSRIQSAPEGTYSGMLDCARKTIAQDGARVLWKGLGPAMARVSFQTLQLESVEVLIISFRHSLLMLPHS